VAIPGAAAVGLIISWRSHLAETPQALSIMSENPVKLRLLINAGLVGGLLVLGLILWLNPGKEDTELPPLTELDKAAVKEIVVQLPEQAPIRIQQQEHGWQIVAPINVPANSRQLEGFLQILSTKPVKKYDSKDLNLADFGLAPPLGIVSIDGLDIKFGETEQLSRQRYVFFGETLYLMPDEHFHMVNLGFFNLVDLVVLPKHRKVKAFKMPGFTVSRPADDQPWQLTPANPKLSADDIQVWVDAWYERQSIHAEHGPFSLKGYEKRIKIEFEDGKPIEYVIVKPYAIEAFYRPELQLIYYPTEEDFTFLTKPPQVTGPAE
jgi:hypothetical protein